MLASQVVKGQEVYTLICFLIVLLLSTYCVSDIVLGTEGKAVKESDSWCPQEFSLLWGKDR